MTHPAPLATIHATCTICRQQASVGPEYDRDAALDMLDMLGWTYLTTHPQCPDCASWRGVKTA